MSTKSLCLTRRLFSLRNLLFVLLLACAVGIYLKATYTPVVAAATTFTVNSTNDVDDGICNVTHCSLREAINAANANGGADTITFSVSGTITLGSTLPAINDDVTIDGTGQSITVSGNNASRVFFINPGKTVTLDGLTIADGQVSGSFPTGFGGGIFNDQATLTVSNSTVRNNNATLFGGGIFNNSGTVTVSYSTVRNNSSGSGGGIANRDTSAGAPTLTVNNSTISGNSSSGTGGGIFSGSNHVSSPATLNITNSTISGNSAVSAGGIGNLDSLSGTPTLNVSNSTVSGNIASDNCGGIRNSALGGTATATLNSTIVSDNSAPSNPDIRNDGTHGTLRGSYNLVETTAGYSFSSGSNNIFGMDPMLGPLANNGGPTKTHALSPGSPALNAGSNAFVGSLTTDQRGAGFPRIANTTVDIGAFEGAALIVTKTDDTNDGACTTADCSLREAIAAASPGDTILFSSLFNTPQTITLTLGELVIDKNLTILGTGASQLTVSGNNASRVFRIAPNTVRLDRLTIANGNGSSPSFNGIGGGIFINSGSTLTVTNSSIAANSANFGGGIFSNTGTLTMINSTVSGNSATFEGGGLTNFAFAMTIVNSTISGNTAGSFAGGIISIGTLTVTGTTISGNRANSDGVGEGSGGGIFTNGNETLNNTIVAGNFRGTVAASTNDDIDGTINTANNDLIGDAGSAGGITNGVNGNIVGVSGVGTIDINTVLNTTLADNGGPTKTHALVCSSPAIDAGDNGAAAGLTTDQRGAGFLRILDGNGDSTATVDIGAFELQVVCNQVTAIGPAQMWLGLKNSDDVGTKFDLLAEVFKNSELTPIASSGVIPNVPGGGSGFNNAVLRIIGLTLTGSPTINAGDTLRFRLSVRIAAASGHRSGTARLWYNGAATDTGATRDAGSRFNATIGSNPPVDYFLRSGIGFPLNTTAGSSKQFIDVTVDRAVGGNPFKPFGTWSKTFP